MRPDDQLLRDLEGLRAEVTFPTTPDFANRIADFLPPRADQALPRRRRVFVTLPRPLAVFAVVTLLILLAMIATMAIPPARESVARWLHIDLPGIRIERVHDGGEQDHVLPSSLGGSLSLGTPVSLEGVNDLLASPLLAPSTALVGEPTAIWQRNDGETISLLYPPSATLPEIGETGIGMLLMRVQPGSDDTMLFVKKSFGVEPPVSVLIEGREGWWIVDGQLTVQPEGMFPPMTRASGHVLIWWDGNDVAWRMESALSKEEAIGIASSLAPLELGAGNRDTGPAVWVDDDAGTMRSLLQVVSLAGPVKEGSHVSTIVYHRGCGSARSRRRCARHRRRIWHRAAGCSG